MTFEIICIEEADWNLHGLEIWDVLFHDGVLLAEKHNFWTDEAELVGDFRPANMRYEYHLTLARIIDPFRQLKAIFVHRLAHLAHDPIFGLLNDSIIKLHARPVIEQIYFHSRRISFEIILRH